jgi:hypothetical protein
MTSFTRRDHFEYISDEEINGLPLIHINLGTHLETGRPRVAKGILAIGNIALGIVSIGGAAVGIVALGGLGLGIVSLAGFAIGVVALGGVALGYEFALGAVALSTQVAIGVLSSGLSVFDRASWPLFQIGKIPRLLMNI